MFPCCRRQALACRITTQPHPYVRGHSSPFAQPTADNLPHLVVFQSHPRADKLHWQPPLPAMSSSSSSSSPPPAVRVGARARNTPSHRACLCTLHVPSFFLACMIDSIITTVVGKKISSPPSGDSARSQLVCTSSYAVFKANAYAWTLSAIADEP